MVRFYVFGTNIAIDLLEIKSAYLAYGSIFLYVVSFCLLNLRRIAFMGFVAYFFLFAFWELGFSL